MEKEAKKEFIPLAKDEKKSSLNKADEAKEQKMQVNTVFLKKNYNQYPSLIDNKQKIIEQTFYREKRQVSHCCRVAVNVVMIIIILLWLPKAHNTVAEYYLTKSLMDKL